MNKTFLAVALLAFSGAASAYQYGYIPTPVYSVPSYPAYQQPSTNDVYSRGYVRQNGTVVNPYMRSAPDSSYNNNWGVSPNVNPYTGQVGTHAPTWNDRSPYRGY